MSSRRRSRWREAMDNLLGGMHMPVCVLVAATALFGPWRLAPHLDAPQGQKGNPVAGNQDKPLDLKGSRSGFARARQAVARDEKSFLALWKEHMPIETPPAPRVDFKKQDVVAVFAGA